MSSVIIPNKYISKLNLYQTQKAIELLRITFQEQLCTKLNLIRATAPLFLESNNGINDDLNGIEKAVEFNIPNIKCNAQIVHSLAKWKRIALYKYGFSIDEGIYTDMNAIRRDEKLDNIHSIYVDQWDWEKIITYNTRTIDNLKSNVNKIVECIINTSKEIQLHFPSININLNHNVFFITTQELEDRWPEKTPKQREDEITKEHGTVFLMKIGGVLKNGKPHDKRSPDYDDWELNGDLLFWNDILQKSIEISSMGIRVDSKSMDSQLSIANCDYRRNYKFHKMVLNNMLPYTIGGGIGQSRLCMLLLQKAHIGEVQSSIWDENTYKVCKNSGILLL